MSPLNQIKFDSDRILKIYNKYAKIHKETESLKDEIILIEKKIEIFVDEIELVRQEENLFYDEISLKYNIPVEKVKQFIGNTILKVLINNE